jgi:uncharacterized protein YciW
MFFNSNIRTEYEMLFKQAADSLCCAYGVKKEEGPSHSEQPVKKDKKDATESSKR